MTNDDSITCGPKQVRLSMSAGGQMVDFGDSFGTEYVRVDIAQAEKEAAVAAEREWSDRLAETLLAVNSQHGGRNAARLLKDFRDHRARTNTVEASASHTNALAERDARVRAEAMREALGRADELTEEAMGADDVRDALLDLIACVPDTDKGSE